MGYVETGDGRVCGFAVDVRPEGTVRMGVVKSFSVFAILRPNRLLRFLFSMGRGAV